MKSNFGYNTTFMCYPKAAIVYLYCNSLVQQTLRTETLLSFCSTSPSSLFAITLNGKLMVSQSWLVSSRTPCPFSHSIHHCLCILNNYVLSLSSSVELPLIIIIPFTKQSISSVVPVTPRTYLITLLSNYQHWKIPSSPFWWCGNKFAGTLAKFFHGLLFHALLLTDPQQALHP